MRIFTNKTKTKTKTKTKKKKRQNDGCNVSNMRWFLFGMSPDIPESKSVSLQVTLKFELELMNADILTQIFLTLLALIDILISVYFAKSIDLRMVSFWSELLCNISINTL